MLRLLIIVCALGLIFTGAAFAQDDPTPAFGAIISGSAATAVPASGGEASIGAAPNAAQEGTDSRLGICNAHTLPDFVPYTIREGDRLGDLLIGADSLTVTQLAALNCLDDPSALPVGATIWIPGAAQPDSAASTSSESTAEATTQATDKVAITAFSADRDPIPNLEGATFEWDAAGDTAYFYTCPVDPDAPCSRPINAAPLPVTHALALEGFRYAGQMRFRLEVVGGEEQAVEDLTVEITCSQESLGLTSGNTACPEMPPLAVFGVWQPFENGVMIYFGDTREIYVMTNDGRLQVYQDTFVEGMIEPELGDIPADRFPAQRGFGIVWRELGAGDSPLGWALAQEIGFDSARQPAGRLSYSTYIQGPGDTVYAVTLLPDSSAGFWAQVKG